jgi:hypothetical protein
MDETTKSPIVVILNPFRHPTKQTHEIRLFSYSQNSLQDLQKKNTLMIGSVPEGGPWLIGNFAFSQ